MQEKQLGAYWTVGLAFAMLLVAVTLFAARQTDRERAEGTTTTLTLNRKPGSGRVSDTPDLSSQALMFNDAGGAASIKDVLTTEIVYASRDDPSDSILVEGRDSVGSVRSQSTARSASSNTIPPNFEDDWTSGLVHRVPNGYGSFVGAVVSRASLQDVENFFKRVEIEHVGNISPSFHDHSLILRQSFGQTVIGQVVPAASHFPNPDKIAAETPPRTDGIGGLGIGNTGVAIDWRWLAIIIGAALIVLVTVAAILIGALLREVGRRTAAERAARASEQEHVSARARLDALFRHSSDSMFIASVDDDENFVFEAVNPVWEKLTRIPAVQAVGKNPINYMPPDRAKIVLSSWILCARAGKPMSYAYSLDTPEGERHWEVSVAPELVAGRPVRRLIGVGRDVTERRVVEAKLRQMERMEAVAQLTTGIAHDFNNMLQAILGALEVLQDQTGLDDEGRASASFAEDAAKRGATLTHRLLAFSRKQTLTPVLVHLADIVRQISSQLSDLGEVEVKVHVDVGEEIWPVRVDRAQLSDCLFNLAMNARDSLSKGGVITFRANNYTAAGTNGLRAGDYVLLSISDNGSGMSAETAARAFEPFFTTKSIGQGTGLGLSMVEGFVRQSGGDVQIETSLGEGTTVSIWLPRGATGVKPLPAHCNDLAQSAVPGSGRILLVDDEQSVRQALSLMLKRAGFSATAVHSGEAALDLLNAGETYDLLVTDQSMPGLTGCQLIEEAMRNWPTLPAMLITGYDKVNGLDQLSGRVPVLLKPFARAEFLKQIRACLG